MRVASMSHACYSEERSHVDSVVAEWDDIAAYLPNVNAPGSRIGSYRSVSANGSTLVGFLELSESDVLRNHILGFQSAVNAMLPGLYHWLDPSSWHCTLRSLS